MFSLKCMSCVGLMVVAKVHEAKGEDVEVPQPNDAITMAPVWQQQIVGNQMIWACVPLPVCEDHLQVTEMTAAEQAIRGGQLLLGAMG